MTGYGQTLVDTKEGVWSVEVKTVNHRYKDILFRMPRELNYIEEELRKIINIYFARGRIEVFINFKQNTVNQLNISLNEQKLRAYFDVIEKIKKLSENINSNINISDLINLPDIFYEVKNEVVYQPEQHPICLAIHDVFRSVNQFRTSEGKRLIDDCIDKMKNIKEKVNDIHENSELMVIEYKDKLKKRLLEFERELPSIDDDRLIAELVIFAEKSCIDEELVRLNSHMQEFFHLASNEQVIGRKLDFLLQEINREVNTIAAKSNSYEISNNVVKIKSELEKIREQIQNIE